MRIKDKTRRELIKKGERVRGAWNCARSHTIIFLAIALCNGYDCVCLFQDRLYNGNVFYLSMEQQRCVHCKAIHYMHSCVCVHFSISLTSFQMNKNFGLRFDRLRHAVYLAVSSLHLHICTASISVLARIFSNYVRHSTLLCMSSMDSFALFNGPVCM